MRPRRKEEGKYVVSCFTSSFILPPSSFSCSRHPYFKEQSHVQRHPCVQRFLGGRRAESEEVLQSDAGAESVRSSRNGRPVGVTYCRGHQDIDLFQARPYTGNLYH